jgi:hypothetical protein
MRSISCIYLNHKNRFAFDDFDSRNALHFLQTASLYQFLKLLKLLKTASLWIGLSKIKRSGFGLLLDILNLNLNRFA